MGGEYDTTLELPRDDSGAIVGFQVGKGAMMLDWAADKEDREYAALFAQLEARNDARMRRAANPERARANLQAWRDRNREKVRERENARRRAERERQPVVCVCEQCGESRTIAYGERKGRFCGTKCKNAWHGKRRKRSRGIRNMGLEADILQALRFHKWLTLVELHAQLPGSKRGSIASKLIVLRADGRVIDDGKKKFRAYAVAL